MQKLYVCDRTLPSRPTQPASQKSLRPIRRGGGKVNWPQPAIIRRVFCRPPDDPDLTSPDFVGVLTIENQPFEVEIRIHRSATDNLFSTLTFLPRTA
jgi:hypothetical protein